MHATFTLAVLHFDSVVMGKRKSKEEKALHVVCTNGLLGGIDVNCVC